MEMREANKSLRQFHIKIRYSFEYEEFNVGFDKEYGGTEANTYYTEDLIDAIGTAKRMIAEKLNMKIKG